MHVQRMEVALNTGANRVDRVGGEESGADKFRIFTPTNSSPHSTAENCVLCGHNGKLPFRPYIAEMHGGGYVMPRGKRVQVITARGRLETCILPLPFSFMLVPHEHPRLHSAISGALSMPPTPNPYRSGLPTNWVAVEEQLLRLVPKLSPVTPYSIVRHSQAEGVGWDDQGWEDNVEADAWLSHPFTVVEFHPMPHGHQVLWQLWEQVMDADDAHEQYQKKVLQTAATYAGMRLRKYSA